MTTSSLLSFEDSTIPIELKELAQWVCWRAVASGDRIEKIPVCASTGNHASSTGPQTWTDYSTAAMAAYTKDGLGIGFVFQKNGGIVGIDLDKCRDVATGAIAPWADAIVNSLTSYTEISPSGTGLHIFVRGMLPNGKRKRGRIEVYQDGRFFTVTGHHLPGTPETIEDRTAELARFHAQHVADQQPFRVQPGNGRPSSPLTEDEVLSKCRTARNAAKFETLWCGDITGYPSHSEADLALIGLLAFYTQDAAQLDALYRQSGLHRSKWNERHGEDTYGAITIRKALANVRESYSSAVRSGPREPAIGSVEDEEELRPADDLGPFPEDAWRGPFAVYRDAMNGTSEAPDTAHFAALWAVAAACLRRRVSFYYAFPHYPNVYLVNYGTTGDSKTSAARQGLHLLPASGVKLLRGVGSAEALGDWMQQSEEGAKTSHLLYIEELATLEDSLDLERSDAKRSEPPPCLAGRTVLYVGGRPDKACHLRTLGEQYGVVVVHHDGGIEDSSGRLAGAVSRADVVMFPVDCVSHGAMTMVKRLCRRALKPYVPLRSAGMGSFVAALERAASASFAGLT